MTSITRVSECAFGRERITAEKQWSQLIAGWHKSAHVGIQGDGGGELADTVVMHWGVRLGDTCDDLVFALVMLAFQSVLWPLLSDARLTCSVHLRGDSLLFVCDMADAPPPTLCDMAICPGRARDY